MALDPILRAAAHLLSKSTPTDHANESLESVLSARLSKYYGEAHQGRLKVFLHQVSFLEFYVYCARAFGAMVRITIYEG